MIDHGRVRSTEKPDPLVIDEYSVWENTNIEPIKETGTEEENGFEGYEYNMVQHEKDAFILLMSEKTAVLDKQLTDTQLALVEIYEGMV